MTIFGHPSRLKENVWTIVKINVLDLKLEHINVMERAERGRLMWGSAVSP